MSKEAFTKHEQCTCEHEDRYHFADGNGFVVCRATTECLCMWKEKVLTSKTVSQQLELAVDTYRLNKGHGPYTADAFRAGWYAAAAVYAGSAVSAVETTASPWKRMCDEKPLRDGRPIWWDYGNGGKPILTKAMDFSREDGGFWAEVFPPPPRSPVELTRELSPSEAASFDKVLARSPRRLAPLWSGDPPGSECADSSPNGSAEPTK